MMSVKNRFCKTTIEYALKDEEMRNEIIHYLKSLDI